MNPIVISQQTARRFVLGKQGLWPGRRWGYYTLPILYGDDLVARLDPKLDRTTMTLEIRAFWHEDDAPVKDADFANALAQGLIRSAKFVGAKRIKITTIKPMNLQKHIQKVIKDF